MTVATWISPKARKGDPSGIAGRGLFAVEPIAAGEVVAVKGGHIVDTATMFAQPSSLQNSEIQIAEGLHLMALTDDEYEPVMLFINHSCEPERRLPGQHGADGDARRRRRRRADDRLRPVRRDGLARADGVRAAAAERAGRRSPATTGVDPTSERRYAGWFSTYLADRIASGAATESHR